MAAGCTSGRPPTGLASRYGSTMMGFGIIEVLFVLVVSLIVPLAVLFALYWTVRLGVRHGMRDVSLADRRT
jgi:hypothetical protein